MTPDDMDRILLIHPDPTTRHELTFLLQHWGFQVLTATDAAQALAEIARTQPDVILMGEGVARTNGDEPCIRIREIYQAPIIILGQEEQERAGIHFLEAGGDVYLPSPLNQRLLLAWIASLLRRSKTRISSPSMGEHKGEGDNL